MISFVLNGQAVNYTGPEDAILLRVLRDTFRLTGTKCGCEQGDCGTCTVLLDRELKKSCLIKVGRIEGKRVETVEGLAVGGRLHPLQEAFLARGAVQCGFCTPGMLMAAKALLDHNLNPTVQDIKVSLKDNLCRCTGYQSIIEAVLEAATTLRGQKSEAAARSEGPVLGSSAPDHDGVLKVTGQLRFAADFYPENVLHGRLLLSEMPSGRITKLDVAQARQSPCVVAVLTAKDIPGLNGFGRMLQDQPVLAEDRVRSVGDILAVVLAESENEATRAVAKIIVEYEKLPGVYNPFSALEEGAPLVHDGGNLLKTYFSQKGDVDAAFANSAVVVEETYSTSMVEHGYLEPEAGVAVPEADGTITVYYPSQVPFASRRQVAKCLDVPEEKVRVVGTPAGGSFGGKTDATIEMILGLGALKTGRPVKITLTRQESLRLTTKRHAFYLRYKTGATKEGKLTAIQARIMSDAGAYAAMSPAVLEVAILFSAGPYVWPSVDIKGRSVYTNNASGGSFRGFGLNQVHFALECQMDRMARALEMDPVEFRLLNAVEIGSETSNGEVLTKSVAIKETLRQVQARLKAEAPRYKALSTASKKIGIGLASGYKNIGYGRGYFEHAGATLVLKPGGQIELRASVVDVGQGIRTVMAQIASEVTGIELGRFTVITGDTGLVESGTSAVGQRQTFVAGRAVAEAAVKFRALLMKWAGQALNLSPHELQVRGAWVLAPNQGAMISLAALASVVESSGEKVEVHHKYVLAPTFPLKSDLDPSYKMYYEKERPQEQEQHEYRNYAAYDYVTQAAIVEVDLDTGEVKLLKLIGAHDAGKALNPQKIKGQLEGSFVMGMGYALSEQFVQERGHIVTNRLKKLDIPTIDRIPEMEAIIVEDPDPEGPFGAKGISEVALVPTAPAISNAIYDAVGIRINSLPMTAEKVREGLRTKVKF